MDLGAKGDWQPFREDLRRTLFRTLTIAIIAGAVIARFSGGRSRWPLGTLLALWPSLGGHWVELGFLNWLRPRLPGARAAQVMTRMVLWFGAGAFFTLAIRLTAYALTGLLSEHWPAWWLGGIGFVGIELAVHFAMQLRRLPNFYDGRR